MNLRRVFYAGFWIVLVGSNLWFAHLKNDLDREHRRRCGHILRLAEIFDRSGRRPGTLSPDDTLTAARWRAWCPGMTPAPDSSAKVFTTLRPA